MIAPSENAPFFMDAQAPVDGWLPAPRHEVRESTQPLVDFGSMWFVTNGVAVVGPVDTTLLVRGVRQGRVTSDCMVKQASWKFWRGLNEIRERAVLWPELATESAPAPKPQPRDSALVLGEMDDFGEALLVAMNVLVVQMRADVALVHRVREPFVGLVTSCAYGERTEERLGEVLRSYDAAVSAARGGWSVMGHPLEGPVKRAVARRLGVRAGGEPLRAVTMHPVMREGRLIAMFELGRFDHPFRACDGDRLATIGRELAERDWSGLVPPGE